MNSSGAGGFLKDIYGEECQHILSIFNNPTKSGKVDSGIHHVSSV